MATSGANFRETIEDSAPGNEHLFRRVSERSSVNGSRMDFETGSGNFYRPDPSFGDIEHSPNNYCLREIKEMLLSGNKEHIAIAAGRILSEMNDDDRILEMINSDVTEFLCDVMVPFDCFVSGTIYNCLCIMSKYEHFYTHNHSSFALETVIRSMHFLLKDSTHDSSIGLPLSTLVQIVQGYAVFRVVPEKKPFQSLLSLFFSLVNENQISEEVKCQTCIILTALFELGLHKPALEICDKWFDVIYEGSRNSVTSDELLYLGCILTDKSLRYLASNGVVENQFLTDLDDNSESEIQNSITRNIILFLIDVVAPSVGASSPRDENRHVVMLECFFSSLNIIFKNSFPQCYQVAQRLSEIGYIHVLTAVIIHTHAKPQEKLSQLCMSVLFEIVLSLSDDVFLFPEMWASGRDHFRREILAGISSLPTDAGSWMEIMTHGEIHYTSKLALIVYYYFYYLTVNRSPNMHLIYPSTMGLMKLTDEMGPSVLLNKTVWFIFVVSQMSTNSESPRSCYVATTKMLDILERQTELSLMYTHHPALLYWSFSSSRISCRIQCEVVKLWLENRSPDCTVLDDLVEKSEDVRVAIFQLLQNGREHVAHSAFSTLRNFLQNSEDHTLSSNIWFMLPQTLAKCTVDASNAARADYMVELATMKVPEQPDMSKTIRIATLLPEVTNISDLISFNSAAKLALQLLELSVRYDESRVLLALLRSHDFVQKIASAVTMESSELMLVSLRTILILWRIDESPGQILSRNQILFDHQFLLKILNGNDLESIKVGLELTEHMLSKKFKSSLIEVSGISPEFLKHLFFDLENILVRYFPLISGSPWKCLKQCLFVDDEKFLAQDCLLHEVVSYGLPYLNETPEMVDFLVAWMEKMQEIERFYAGYRRIRPRFFLETIRVVAAFLVENFVQDSGTLSRKVLECCDHFCVDTNEAPFNKLGSRCYYRVSCT